MHEEITDLAYFQTLVGDPDNIPLLETAASLAQDAYPGLDLQRVLSSVDYYAEQLGDRCRDESTELGRLHLTVEFFYKGLAFSGNINDYYSPDNSFIHKVLETRRGIPVSLAVVFIELARHVGLDGYGISFPGHFLVGVELHQGAVVIDPFTGVSLSNEALQERLEPFRGPLGLEGTGEIHPARFVQPASSREILLRMLRNLREIYNVNNQQDCLQRVAARLEILESA